jgi:metal-dependent amidase/aminoacylase/carboxypeptidase family protein
MSQPVDPVPEAWRAGILRAIDERAERARELARWMGSHPELSLEEHATSARYIEELGSQGFAVEASVADMPTAFLARHGSEAAPLCVALLAEMDALPGIGHACGHNLSGPASILAAEAVASVLPQDAVRLVVVGSPAEETGVGKRRLVEAGIFGEADVAMMAH